ncbi:MAG: hypothetical protein JWR84_3799 [Caulobacter sp.]|nr:hypothetical protein [Caulobacter sp.]
MLLVSLAAAAALAFQQAPAPAEPPPADDATVSGVVISAPPLDEKKAIESFVETIAADSGNGRIARWDRKVCPGVAGVKPEYAQVVADHIAALSLKVGLEPGEPGCKVNVLVVFTADADGFVKRSLKETPQAYSRYDLEMTSGRKALRRFQGSDAPVRWWHVTHRVTEDGVQYNSGDQVQVYSTGRISSRTRDDFDRAIVVVDVARVGEVRFAALADYLAFVSLAQIDPQAEPKTGSSILNLFADKALGIEPSEALTSWDVAYLTGVYEARRDTRNSDGQKRDITRTMGKALKEGEEAGDKPKE